MGPFLFALVEPELPLSIELALLRDPLECLAGSFDPVLMLIAFQRQQLHNFEGAGGAETTERTRCVTDVLANRIFVNFKQRTLPSTRRNRPTLASKSMNVRSRI